MDINIRNLCKSYGDDYIFKNFNIIFKENEVNVILGKSGCGKTTLLKILAGIIEADSGKISGMSKKIGYVFQEDRLIEWATVKENMKFALRKDFNGRELEEVCKKYLNLVGIEKYENFYPKELSGGMRQRVNIARAFAKPSKIIIMDEPFKSLDMENRESIMASFKEALEREKRTVIFVTHDLYEAHYFNGCIYSITLGGNNCYPGLTVVNDNLLHEEFLKIR